MSSPFPPEIAAERDKVLRDFFVGDRLQQIPAQRKKRQIILQQLMERFASGRDYPERAVNNLLRTANEDVATLRRELYECGYLERANGIYRVAHQLRPRSSQFQQILTGDEAAWHRDYLERRGR